MTSKQPTSTSNLKRSGSALDKPEARGSRLRISNRLKQVEEILTLRAYGDLEYQ